MPTSAVYLLFSEYELQVAGLGAGHIVRDVLGVVDSRREHFGQVRNKSS
jgi:hypothetical protein